MRAGGVVGARRLDVQLRLRLVREPGEPALRETRKENSLPRSVPLHREREGAPLPADGGQVNPEDPQVLEKGSVAKRTGIDGTEARGGRNVADELLRFSVVAGKKHLSGSPAKPGSLWNSAPNVLKPLMTRARGAAFAIAAASEPSGGGLHIGPSFQTSVLPQSTTTLPTKPSPSDLAT